MTHLTDIIKKIKKLEEKLIEHDNNYFELDSPVISDSEYDILSLEYRKLRKDCPEYESGYKQGFSHSNSDKNKVNILEPMLSVSKKTNKEDYLKWCDGSEGAKIHEDKIDGMALRLIYVYGKLSQIHSRGNGEKGTDLSNAKKIITGIPDFIEPDKGLKRTEYTGEAFCYYDDFYNFVKLSGLNRESMDPRSTVSGLIKRTLPHDKEVSLPIHFKVYHGSAAVRNRFKTYTEFRSFCVSVGFDVPLLIDKGTLDHFLSLSSKPILSYPVDGVVGKFNDLSKWEKEQKTEYWSYATCYKFPTLAIETKVTGIDWTLSLKGMLIPVLNYLPVVYDGTTLSRVKLDYPDYYFKEGLSIGSTIKITKSNEIIPKLLGIIKKGTGIPLDFPTSCPFCQTLVKKIEDNAFCFNTGCKGRLLIKFTRMVNVNSGLDIKGLGTSTITKLIENGKLVHAQDLFLLTSDDLIEAGMGKPPAKSVVDRIKKAQSAGLVKWLSALGLSCLGHTRSKKLISELTKTLGSGQWGVNELLTLLNDSQRLDDLFGKDGLTINQEYEVRKKEIKCFLSHYVFTEENVDKVFTKTVGITGACPFLTRTELVKGLEKEGILLINGINKMCNVVLVGISPSLPKINKAKTLGIPIVNIDSLQKLSDIIIKLSV